MKSLKSKQIFPMQSTQVWIGFRDYIMNIKLSAWNMGKSMPYIYGKWPKAIWCQNVGKWPMALCPNSTRMAGQAMAECPHETATEYDCITGQS